MEHIVDFRTGYYYFKDENDRYCIYDKKDSPLALGLDEKTCLDIFKKCAKDPQEKWMKRRVL